MENKPFRKHSVKKRGYPRQKGYRAHKSKMLKIRPGADAKLKRIFESIGVPAKKPFQPDRFQLEALSAITHSDCLVTAPTGSGKTWIAEKAIERILAKNEKCWYATPLKALSNTLYAHFNKVFGADRVGILTGDRKENTEAPVIVGTTEILRNQLYDAMHQGEDLQTDFVVMDEAHFLGDEERGVVWEEILIYLPSRIPILMLSATIGNAAQISGWLQSIRKKSCDTITETTRSVPLCHLLLHPSGTLFPFFSDRTINGKKGIYKKVTAFIGNKHAPRLSKHSQLPPMGDIIRVLKKYNLLPAIFFLKSRADCDGAIELCTEENLLREPERKMRLNQKIEELVSSNSYIAMHKQKWHLEHLGVASHHSGQLPAWKIVVETLMTQGLLDAVFATSTVAAGVNFPARTVVILNSDRYNGVEFIPLDSTEFHQMTGRCGRRGMDNIGFTVILPGKFMDLRLIARLVNSPPENIQSRIRIDFSMVLNLLLSHAPEQIEGLLEKSFASWLLFNDKKTQPAIIADPKHLWHDFLRHMNFLRQHGYISENDELTADGIWASKLRIDQPVMVAESIRLNILPASDPALLAAIIASFVSEKETDDDIVDKSLTPKTLLTTFLTLKKKLRPFVKDMLSGGFTVRPLYFQPASTMYSWASGQPWESVFKTSKLDEGNLARLVLRTADNLRHIKNLRHVFPSIAETASTAIDLIMKEPVVEYYES